MKYNNKKKEKKLMDCCKTNNREECCKDINKSSLLKDHKETEGEKMRTKTILWIVIGAMFVAALFLTFKAGSIGNVEAVQAAGSAASSGMVGGC